MEGRFRFIVECSYARACTLEGGPLRERTRAIILTLQWQSMW
jgi:hypothetical protein